MAPLRGRAARCTRRGSHQGQPVADHRGGAPARRPGAGGGGRAARACHRRPLNAETTRQRYPEHCLYPPPFAGSYITDGRIALDFSYDLDFWGKNRALLAAARSGVQAAQADQAAARLALAVAVVRAYIQLDLQYALLDVTNDNLKQQQSILDLTQQRVTAGLENTARVKQSEGQLALIRAGLAFVQANIELARNQLADLVGAGPDRGRDLTRPQLAAPEGFALPAVLPVGPAGTASGRRQCPRPGGVRRPTASKRPRRSSIPT